MSSNDKTIRDEDGNASDWIELYNGDSESVNLSGFFLSDDSLEIDKWQFGNAVIEPGGYLIIFASDKDKFETYWHTNFKISASGEEVILSDSNETVVDLIWVPAAESDISYGRVSDGALAWMLQEPTPGAANSGQPFQRLAEPVNFSPAAGYFPAPISVSLTANGNRIFYTLDGSAPDTTDPEYTAPLTISTTTVVKAISIRQGYLPGRVMTSTYIINENISLPIISLSADPFDLFDADSGIYTNYTMDWERPAHVEFFDDDKNLGISEDCGINITGNQSANWDQKSIALKFKDKYGVSEINYPLFPDFRITTFKSFLLRNSGNDWQYTHIRDAMMQTLVENLDIDYQEYRPAVTFINGQYWGIYNIREKISEHYIANRHGVDPDNIDLLEDSMQVIVGDAQGYQQLIDYISNNDMSTDAAYAYLDSAIDLDECMLYFAAQAYYDNMDWPAVNIRFWRERSAAGKWRWILSGLDFGFGLYAHNASEDHIAFMFATTPTRYSNPPWATLLQRKLVENPIIRNRFINQIADLLNTNFTTTNVTSVIDSLADHISGELARHRTRWKLNGEDRTKLKTFASDRPAYLRNHVRNYFNCGADGRITVNATEGGTVQLNTLTLQSADLPFKGVYFIDNPIHLKAIPAPGYKFDGWSGAVTAADDSISLTMSRSTTIYASFSLDSSGADKIVINEINYNPAADFNSGDWIELYNASDQAVDISGWYFSDSNAEHRFIFAEGTVIDSAGYLVLVANDSAFAVCFPDVPNYVGEMDFGLSGDGELIKLMNSNGYIIDSLTYDEEAPWPLAANGAGATLELKDAKCDNALAENWQASQSHGTPGKINSGLSDINFKKKDNLPREFALLQNYPNPFNPTTTIGYQLPVTGYLTIKAYDLLGREVATVFEGVKAAGNYSVSFDASDLASGIYLYILKTNDFTQSKKMILLR